MPKCGRSTVTMFLLEPVARRAALAMLESDAIRRMPAWAQAGEFWVCLYCYSRLVVGPPVEPPLSMMDAFED